jgi:tRNA (guanine-N7-)-methyltransferase
METFLQTRKLNSLTMAWPTNWAELFGRERPLIVEIGFGYATYLVHLAQENPEANVVGLEIANECLTRAEKAMARLNLTNLRVIHSTAGTALHHLFEPETIHEIHINFPDPWFKKRHGHRRLMKRATLDAMVNRLVPGGRLYLATDILEYAEMCAELFRNTRGLTNLNQNSIPLYGAGFEWVHEMPGRVVTKYEAKAREAGSTCYYFVYRRNELPVPGVPVIKDVEMPHVIVKSPFTLDEILARFTPTKHDFGDTHINIMYSYRGEGAGLFEVFVSEPTIDQRVAILLVKREQVQEYTLQLGMLGHPRPTAGIHKAVQVLSEWLVGLHPESEIVGSKLRT